MLWIMTLFVIGLEREAERLSALATDSVGAPSPRSTQSHTSHHKHSAQEYEDAAKSASKILFEFVRNRMDPARLTPPTPPPPPAGWHTTCMQSQSRNPQFQEEPPWKEAYLLSFLKYNQYEAGDC